MILAAPQHLRLGDETAEVTLRTLITGSASDPQQPLRRDPTLGLADSVTDHIGHLIAIVGPLNPRWRRPAGLELLRDPFDGLVDGAAQFGGPFDTTSQIRPDLLIGRNDVHAVPRRLQWNSPVVAVCGWHLHRHHPGQQFLIDTTNTGRTFIWPPVGSLHLATSGDFLIATDTPLPASHGESVWAATEFTFCYPHHVATSAQHCPGEPFPALRVPDTGVGCGRTQNRGRGPDRRHFIT